MESILLGEKYGFYLEPLSLAQAVGSLSWKVNHRFIAIKTLMSTFFFFLHFLRIIKNLDIHFLSDEAPSGRWWPNLWVWILSCLLLKQQKGSCFLTNVFYCVNSFHTNKTENTTRQQWWWLQTPCSLVPVELALFYYCACGLISGGEALCNGMPVEFQLPVI